MDINYGYHTDIIKIKPYTHKRSKLRFKEKLKKPSHGLNISIAIIIVNIQNSIYDILLFNQLIVA